MNEYHAPTFHGTRLPFETWVPPAPAYAPEVRESARLESARDERMRRAQMHCVPLRFFAIVAPGINVPFNAVAASYVAATSQIITGAYLHVKIHNGISVFLAAALSKVPNVVALAAGTGGDTSILERWDIFTSSLTGEWFLPRGQDSPQNFYLNVGEGIYFLIAGTVSGAFPGAFLGGNAALYYQITERQAV
jgi:hypothetical protein